MSLYDELLKANAELIRAEDDFLYAPESTSLSELLTLGQRVESCSRVVDREWNALVGYVLCLGVDII